MASRVLLTVLLCILILTAGCTALEKSQEALSPTVGYSGETQSYERAASPGPGSTDSFDKYKGIAPEATPAAGAIPAQTDQKIIKTADVRLEVADVQISAEKIKVIAESMQGIVQSSSVSAGQSNQYSGTVTIRIPSEQFDTTLNQVKELGKVTSSSVTAEDVTEEYIDLTARKTALENQLTQYNRILGQAVNVSEILEVQQQIERVQVELDRIVGRMKYLDSRISFSTITIRLFEPAQVVTSSGYSIASVISEGLEGFTETLIFLVVFVMTILPLIIIAAIGYLVYRRIKKPAP